ncbi:hypothetical protein Goklo_002439 [Gossypium klotzschianum]|uniref:F-box domain-containing protein n=1 Tax=Gossypium klotzschianum TaxID=34286 RepID=A0A7J8VT93_9ROSI|nr:hypothetical protein [Gossypium klotzschianum]
MEPPTKSLDLIALKTGDDRFSDLPEYIILHVLSFIGSNDIVGLSYLSRKFRQLTMCSRNLYFKLGCDSKKCTSNCKQVQGFLKGFLNQHKEPQIDRFRLHWFCRASRYDVKGPIFSLCVQKALRHKVQELDIGVPVTAGRAFHLPAGIESLRALKLELQGGKPKLFAFSFLLPRDIIAIIPSVVDLNNLKDIDIADFLRCCSCLNSLTFRYDSNADQLSETELVDQLRSKLGDECGNTRFACRVINCKDSENKGFNGRV